MSDPAARMSDPRSFFAPPESPSSAAPPLPSGEGGSSNSSGPSITYLKFLVSGSQAGKIIGTDGVKIEVFRDRSSAQIQVSTDNVFFPGTSERVVMVSGSKDHVLGAMAILLNEMLPEDEEEKGAKPKVRLAVPKLCCGALIGKGGSMIRSLVSKSLADIRVSQVDENSERLVIVTGSFESQLKAIELILEELIKDVKYQPNLMCPFHYGGGVVQSYGASQVQYEPHGLLPLVAPQSYGASQVRYEPHGLRPLVAPQSYGASQASLTIGIHDAKIGPLVGVGGTNLKYIMQQTGTSIKISDKGDFIPGTCNRKVTITAGCREALEAARSMIMQHLQ